MPKNPYIVSMDPLPESNKPASEFGGIKYKLRQQNWFVVYEENSIKHWRMGNKLDAYDWECRYVGVYPRKSHFLKNATKDEFCAWAKIEFKSILQS